ncbi:MAG: response regulator transcription factor [Clostridia bacterium]|nr:response regulator transcription factor [Clostridia bacterium]
MIKVLIADDQTLLRESLSFILDSDGEIEVVGLAEDGRTAIEKCMELLPDIVLMDIEMPVVNGVEATKAIKECHPDTKIIMLTTFENPENIMGAFVSGADGYLVKDVSHSELLLAVKCVAFGLTVIHESVREIMIDKFSSPARVKKDLTNILTDKELEIMKLVAAGKSNKEIGADLNYSFGTIKNYISRILEKLEFTDRIQIAIYSIENGIVQDNK